MKKYLIHIIILFLEIPAISQDQKNIELIDQWIDTSIVKGPENARFNDVWGFSFGGENYCALGSTEGTHIFSVKKDRLEFLDFKPGKYQSLQVIHRDYKTYRNYLYAVCDEGMSSLQIFNLSYLPDSISLVYDSNAFFQVCHNIFIDTSKAKLYACGPDNLGLKILDISEPVNPQLIYEFNEVNYVHDCYVRNDTAFLNCGFDGLQVYYFGGPIPVQRGLIDFYPDQGYNHSGWLSPKGYKYAFIDETEGTKIKLCKIDDLAQIHIDEQFGSSAYKDNVPHNIFMLDQLAIVAYYKEGLRIFDTGTAPVGEISCYDTYSEDSEYKLNGAWGVYVFPDKDQILISDRQNGLFLFHFPITIFEGGVGGTFITSSPFIDENSYLIPRDHFTEDQLFFTIATIDGKVIYSRENYNNWVQIPIDLAPGVYVYSIFNVDGQLLEGGKFVKGN